ncbi:hypothetical protein ANN_09992 [Periplaneta americana]|uniref:Transposase n=1 Tax=Periplaneta americana TaxID=6978 RepID=A0ABQ8TPM4_PERAM|nr:hypothetical protein ANN_09992 [Periplaneta americana]
MGHPQNWSLLILARLVLFPVRIVTGVETWVRYVNAETKLQSMQWGHTHSPKKSTKCRQTLSTTKLFFWETKGILLVEFLERNATINAERYCNTLTNLKRAIQNKRRDMLNPGMIFLHDNARPHTARRTATKLQQFNWKVSDHPPCSPDFAPSDYHLFMHMNTWLGSKRFDDDEDLKTSVMRPEDVARAVALYDDGRSVRYIANVMNMARSTTHDAIKRYRETLEYTRRPGSGRPRATNPNEDRDWRNGQWSCVLFTDESRFNLCSPDGREKVWRRRGERFSQCCISENVPYGGGVVMVWAGVCTDARTEYCRSFAYIASQFPPPASARPSVKASGWAV